VLRADLRKPSLARRLSLNGLPEGPARLRLVEVGLSWPPETFLALKLGRLAERGYDVIVTSGDPPRVSGREIPGVTVMQLEGVDGSPERAQRVHRRLIGLRPDVLHFEWLTVASSHLPVLKAWRGPIVVSCRGADLPLGAPLPNRPDGRALEAVFARADAVHCVAEALMRDALVFGLAAEKARVIRSGVDAEFFRPPLDRPPGDDGFRIVSIGWLRWLKGHEYALLVIAELVRRGIAANLEILGGDPTPTTFEESQRARIMHTARDLGVSDRVRVHGEVEPTAVRAALHRADAFLQTSVSEGLPNVILEAMACEVPVVVTDVGGTGEAVRHGIDGFLVPPRDPGAAATALERLWREPDLRARMGQAARARVEAEFTAERLTQEWAELYEQVVSGRA
jgi:glycosyltransferase involved in cell wall biosynthesis